MIGGFSDIGCNLEYSDEKCGGNEEADNGSAGEGDQDVVIEDANRISR